MGQAALRYIVYAPSILQLLLALKKENQKMFCQPLYNNKKTPSINLCAKIGPTVPLNIFVSLLSNIELQWAKTQVILNVYINNLENNIFLMLSNTSNMVCLKSVPKTV